MHPAPRIENGGGIKNLLEIPSNSLDPDQARHFVGSDLDKMSGLIWIQTVCKGYQQTTKVAFVCVEVLRPSQPNGVMSSAVSLPNHTFTGQA